MVARIGFATVLVIGVVSVQAHAATQPDADDDDREEAESAARKTALKNTKEVAHEVSVSLLREPGAALFTVTRTFEARAPAMPICIDTIFEFPEKAAIMSFAIRTDRRWRGGVLRSDDPLRPRHGRPKLPRKGQPWATLDWGVNGADIETPMFRAAGRVQIRYTVWAKGEPTMEGHRWVYCPSTLDTDDDSVAPLAFLPLAPRVPIEMRPQAEAPECREIESREPPRTKMAARFGLFQLDARVWAWRAELVTPVSLGKASVPAAVPVVFVLDGSRSQERQGGLATQLAIVQAYLANVSGAEAELVLVGRNASRVFGRFVPAADVGRALPSDLTRRPLGNGSSLDRGASIATELLKQAGGPGRIVLFTDGELRSAFDPKDAIATLRRAPRGTIADLVYPVASSHGQGASRSGWDPPAGIATALGGGFYRVDVQTPPVAGSQELAAKVRKLLAPDSVELIVMERRGAERDGWPGMSTLEFAVAGDEVVLEGQSPRPAPRSAALTGWLGGNKLTFPFRPDPVMQRQMPRLIDPESDSGSCQEGSPRLRAAGLRDGFLTKGLRFWVPGAGAVVQSGPGFDFSDACLNSPINAPLGSGPEVKPDALPAELLAAARRCGGDLLRAKIETQGDEILDVSIEGSDDERRRCAAEAVWSFLLPAKFNEKHSKRVSYQVVLSPPP